MVYLLYLIVLVSSLLIAEISGKGNKAVIEKCIKNQGRGKDIEQSKIVRILTPCGLFRRVVYKYIFLYFFLDKVFKI